MTAVIDLAAYSGSVLRAATPIRLESPERLELERWVSAHGTPQEVRWTPSLRPRDAIFKLVFREAAQVFRKR